MKRNSPSKGPEEKILDLEKSYLVHGSENNENNWSTAIESFLKTNPKPINEGGEKKFYLSHECRSEDIAFSNAEGEHNF